MSFYSVQPSEMARLEIDEVMKMDQAIDMMKAQDVLTAFQIVCFPNFKKQTREQLHKHFHKIANPGVWETDSRKVTLADLGRILGQSKGMNG